MFAINSLSTGLNAANDVYRAFFANSIVLAISAAVTLVCVYILNKTTKVNRYGILGEVCGFGAALGTAMFMASLAALTSIEIVHYANVSCFVAICFLFLGYGMS